MTTILFNKKTQQYYLVTGLTEGTSENYLLGDKTGRTNGDFIIISSGKQNSNAGVTTAGFSVGLGFLKKIALILFLISLIPFSSVISTGYMHLLNEN